MQIIQRCSKSLTSDFKITCTQGIYMLVVFTSLLLKNAAPRATSLLVLCLRNSQAGAGDLARGSPMAGQGKSLPVK